MPSRVADLSLFSLPATTSRTPSMYVDEKSDEAIVLASPVR